MFWTLVGLRDDELAEFSFDGRGRGREGGRECYEVTTWVDSIMCGERERENWFDRKKNLRSGRAQKSLEKIKL